MVFTDLASHSIQQVKKILGVIRINYLLVVLPLLLLLLRLPGFEPGAGEDAHEELDDESREEAHYDELGAREDLLASGRHGGALAAGPAAEDLGHDAAEVRRHHRRQEAVEDDVLPEVVEPEHGRHTAFLQSRRSIGQLLAAAAAAAAAEACSVGTLGISLSLSLSRWKRSGLVSGVERRGGFWEKLAAAT